MANIEAVVFRAEGLVVNPDGSPLARSDYQIKRIKDLVPEIALVAFQTIGIGGLLPIDQELQALFDVVHGEPTASGGAYDTYSKVLDRVNAWPASTAIVESHPGVITELKQRLTGVLLIGVAMQHNKAHHFEDADFVTKLGLAGVGSYLQQVLPSHQA